MIIEIIRNDVVMDTTAIDQISASIAHTLGFRWTYTAMIDIESTLEVTEIITIITIIVILGVIIATEIGMQAMDIITTITNTEVCITLTSGMTITTTSHILIGDGIKLTHIIVIMLIPIIAQMHSRNLYRLLPLEH